MPHLAVSPALPPFQVGSTLRRHRKKMALCFVVVMGAVGAALYLWPRSYSSEAKLLVRMGRENVTMEPTATFGQPNIVAVPPSLENDVNSITEVVRSRVVLEKVVDRIGPAAVLGETAFAADAPAPTASDASHRYQAVRQLGRMLRVEAIKKSNVLAITYEGASPELAQAVVAKLVDLSLDHHQALSRTPKASRFLAEQAERLRKELAGSEVALKDLKNQLGLASPDGQRLALVSRIGRLEDEQLQTASTLAATEAEVRLWRDNLAELPPTQMTAHTKGLPNQPADAMRAQLYTLQLDELKLLARFSEQNPEVQLLRKLSAAAKEILAKEDGTRDQVTVGPSRTYEEARLALLKLEPALAALKAKAQTLGLQLQREQDALKRFNETQLAVSRQQRLVDLQESLFRKYAESLEQAQIDQALTHERISNISIVQPATYDLKPVGPRVGLSLAVGFVFAVLSSVGVAALAERRVSSPVGRSS